MKRCFLLLLGVCLMLTGANTREQLPRPEAREVLRARGQGDQVYTCKAKADHPDQFEWAFKAEAKLYDDQGNEIGKHYFNDKGSPTWEAKDGSKVAGKLEKKVPAAKAGNIPWLLLKATSHEGEGTFSKITYIQRVDTEGGLPPADKPTSDNEGKEVRVKYSATYVFFAD